MLRKEVNYEVLSINTFKLDDIDLGLQWCDLPIIDLPCPRTMDREPDP